MARQFEWGGEDRQGRQAFAAHRPGWPEPIQQLFARTGVSIFFQGHDHVYAHELVDGVVYQTVPEPADPNYALYFAEAYPGADVLPNSGYLHIQVDAQRVRVKYQRSWLPGTLPPGQDASGAAASYEVMARPPAH